MAGGVFANNCPLWTYILAETRHHMEEVPITTIGDPAKIKTPKLGEVGGRRLLSPEPWRALLAEAGRDAQRERLPGLSCRAELLAAGRVQGNRRVQWQQGQTLECE